jgi:hypothetical protein
VSVKKAKGKGKSKAKKAKAKSKRPGNTKPADMGRVRENINNLVKNSARKIANEVIKVAKTGQLASAKYLFEAVGLYPATGQTEERPIETTMAHQLLTRMGIPLEPVVCEEDSVAVVTSALKASAVEAAKSAGENSEEEREEEQLPAEGEQ